MFTKLEIAEMINRQSIDMTGAEQLRNALFYANKLSDETLMALYYKSTGCKLQKVSNLFQIIY